MPQVFRRITNLLFALLIATFSVNLSGVMTLQNAHATFGNTDPSFSDQCGTANDTYSVPNESTGSYYTVNGTRTDGPVTNPGTGTVTIKKYSWFLFGYVEAGTWKHTFDSTPCPINVTPTIPTFNDLCSTTNDTYIIPATNGVTYQVKVNNGSYNTKSANTYTVSNGDTISIKAVAINGYTIMGASTWSQNFTNAACPVTPPAPTKNDSCGTANDTYIIGTTNGVKYQKLTQKWVWIIYGVWGYQTTDWDDINPGTYAGTNGTQIRAVVLNGFVLSGVSEWTLAFTDIACDIPVTALVATAQDEICGTANDTYTIPDVAGVQYYVNNVATSPGTYPTAGALSLSITTSAKQGYVLTAPASWTLTFTNKTCVTPTEPTKVDVCGKTNDKYTIPTTTGVVYKVNNSTKSAGTYQTNSDVTVTATPLNSNYVLTGTVVWPLDFSQQNCPATATKPVVHDVCGAHNDYYTIPSIEGVDYKVSKFGVIYTGISAGNHWADGTFYVKAEPKNGYELTGSTFWPLYLNPADCKVIANDPTFIDECGSVNDKFIVPTTEHVKYKIATKWIWLIVWIPIEFEDINAGTYDGNGLVKIVAEPEDGYYINGDRFWIHNFDSSKCGIDLSADPTFVDSCGTADDSYTIVPAQGVIYKVNGAITPAGFFPNATGDVTITAEPIDPNHVINGDTSWAHAFSDTTCPDITATALCDQAGVVVSLTNRGDSDGTAFVNGNPVVVPGNDSVTATVPYTLYKASVMVTDDKQQTLIDKEFDCTPGRGSIGGGTNVVLTNTTSNAPKGIMLPETGAHPIAQAFMLAIAGLTTYGIMFFLVNRRELTSKE